MVDIQIFLDLLSKFKPLYMYWIYAEYSSVSENIESLRPIGIENKKNLLTCQSFILAF